MGNGRSQETLDSVGLQTSSEKGAEEQEEAIEEGNYSSRPKNVSSDSFCGVIVMHHT